MFEKKHMARPKCNNAMKERGARQQLCLRKDRTSDDRIFRKTI
jgi:hypothetical protein